ncbi:unnamed protein product [marine sediment metagenome]|uniref:DUF2188 domain-containing protein n=1 Tax=marine sediment metagenome TaxID=412755 RepID=X1RRM5_9ZZZZ
MAYVYIRTEPGVWTVGFYEPHGEWVAESDHSSKEDAAARVHYLNGGNEPENPYILHGAELERTERGRG